MATFLLKWDEPEFSITEFEEYFHRYEKNEPMKWSCGVTTKKILIGDKFYLMKTGSTGGIIGSGLIISSPYKDKHFNKVKADNGEFANFVNVAFDSFIHPNGSIPISRTELNEPKFSDPVWSSQGSGKTIKEEIAHELDKLWLSRVEIKDFSTADEINDSDISTLSEGGIKKINVNAYERNAEARRKCLEKWGYACTVCNFHFELRYGSIGRKYIHVHHLQPLSSVKTSHDVEPIKDLRPVCPNCHAMLHSQNPPLSIEELQDIFNSYNRVA
jgi:5-methylcytosine-specific restriction protein A